MAYTSSYAQDNLSKHGGGKDKSAKARKKEMKHRRKATAATIGETTKRSVKKAAKHTRKADKARKGV